MQNFIFNERIEPKKRAVNERIKDFREIYEIYNPNEAATQADRCVQCGDPYCHNACPLHNFIPHWLKTVAEKDLEFAFKISNESSPFPEIMGRVCPQDRLCEGACTLNEGYGAITIGAIETFISEEGFKRGLRPEFEEKLSGKVAIIGSGPAGLSCATYLLRAGIEPHVFERADRAGGLMMYGIPNFKLDKKVVQRRIDWLLEAGMKLTLGVEVGKSLDFGELLENYDAVFIGIGATKPRRAGIENEEAGIMAMDFLTNVQKKIFGDPYDKEKADVKEKTVVVIGGGDTAMDCVRTSIREGAKKAICAYRRDAASMPGSRKEVKNAEEEGAEFVYNVAPTKILLDDEGKVIGVEFVKTISTTTKDGQRKLEIIKNSEFTMDADVVIFALGFENTPLEFLSKHGIETNRWGAIKVNEHYETTKPGVYAGGDCYRGAHLVVTAAYDGREAAKAIAKRLKG
ncbi:MAG: glutamate synthase small subunit [Epsilonproteobacteria bacterium]|nr:glutamate synthase small subunit [Campylobacterota bacterium]NPA64528.1 glutamate synthase subunit beta [Campylobacterota bacterium]